MILKATPNCSKKNYITMNTACIVVKKLYNNNGKDNTISIKKGRKKFMVFFPCVIILQLI